MPTEFGCENQVLVATISLAAIAVCAAGNTAMSDFSASSRRKSGLAKRSLASDLHSLTPSISKLPALKNSASGLPNGRLASRHLGRVATPWVGASSGEKIRSRR